MGIGLKEQLRRVEKAAQGQLESFRTRDGRTYVYDPQEVGIAMFMYTCALIRDPYQPDEPEPEEPAFLEAIRNAVNPDEVIRRFEGPDPSRQFVDVRLLVYGAEEGTPHPVAGEIEDLSD
jgi:hypothetical protein